MMTEYYSLMYDQIMIAIILILLFIVFAWLYDYYYK